MKIEKLPLSGLLLITPDVHPDERGFFMETYRQDVYREQGIAGAFVQDSHSHSKRGVVRGIKFQYDKPTDKFVRVAYGSIFAVAVDLRPHSPTFGKFEAVTLSDENKIQFYLPFGFGFGFCATSEVAGVLYKLSAVHNEQGSGTIRWDDSDINIAWPTTTPILSPSDADAPTFKELIANGTIERMRGASLE
jgi:dTDP-4-dehydrorhamnose 3,5-epimerase